MSTNSGIEWTDDTWNPLAGCKEVSPGCTNMRSQQEAAASAFTAQVGGSHYKDMAIQPVEFIHKNGLGFVEGSVIKYLCRHKVKGGAVDIRKAIHLLEILLALEYGESHAKTT